MVIHTPYGAALTGNLTLYSDEHQFPSYVFNYKSNKNVPLKADIIEVAYGDVNNKPHL